MNTIGSLFNTNQMPNGWLFSYSGSKMFDREKRDVDLGIVPDKLLLNNVNSSNTVGDNLIDSAIALLK